MANPNFNQHGQDGYTGHRSDLSKRGGHPGDERGTNGRLQPRNITASGERYNRKRWTTKLRSEALDVLEGLATEYGAQRCEVVEALLLDPMARGYVKRYLSELKAARLLGNNNAING